MTAPYCFKVTLSDGKVLTPKGLYFQGKYVVLVGCAKAGHTIRDKHLVSEVNIEITKQIDGK